MARIPMTEGFSLIAEGWDVFRVLEATYKENYGKIKIVLMNSQGQKHTETFSLKKSTGEWNEGALGAFSYFAKTCLNDFEVEDVDVEELVGHFIKAEVVHNKVESTKEGQEGKILTFAQLGSKEVADTWEKEPNQKVKEAFAKLEEVEQSEEPEEVEDEKTGVGLDLDSILGSLPF